MATKKTTKEEEPEQQELETETKSAEQPNPVADEFPLGYVSPDAKPKGK